ncbi:MAG: response regulator [Verrucomicrobia bacterium]|nr:response regulator [Verrucomicrobiota bacterium]
MKRVDCSCGPALPTAGEWPALRDFDEVENAGVGIGFTPDSHLNSTDMPARIRILHLEDDPLDGELVSRSLRAAGMDCEILCVTGQDDFLAALDEGGLHLILADHRLAAFDGATALAASLAKQPLTPFLFVTGSIGEEQAVETLKLGATDYVLKDRLSRLGPAARRALAAAAEKRQRMLAEEQIREQAALLDQAQDAIFVCDLQDRISYWNLGAERMFGWTAQEALGQNALALLAPEPSAHLTEASQRVLETGEWRGELTFTGKEAQPVIVESRWTLVRSPEGKLKSKLIVNTDITDRKKLQAQLLRSQRLESVGTLAGGIAHDLNNVLAPILMATQLLRARLREPGELKLLDTVEASAQRGAEMVKQIVSFARGAHGERTIVQLRSLVRDMVKVARETFPPSIHLRTQLPSDVWTISGDATQIYQVLMNLCINARDAMPSGGTLGIELENVILDEPYAAMQPEAKPGPYVKLSVIDTGIGVAPGILDKIFEPFFTTKANGKGSGLGLSTVRSIVQNHGGFVTVSSALGTGTRFTVHLPAAASPESLETRTEQPDLPLCQGELVLVVDDERTVREITKSVLENHLYRVLVASDGTEAVALCAEHQAEVKVVLTDMAMPFMDGPATIRAVQRLNPAAKIIAVSGLLEEGKLAEIPDRQRMVFLQKPYTTEQLLSALDRLLHHR